MAGPRSEATVSRRLLASMPGPDLGAWWTFSRGNWGPSKSTADTTSTLDRDPRDAFDRGPIPHGNGPPNPSKDVSVSALSRQKRNRSRSVTPPHCADAGPRQKNTVASAVPFRYFVPLRAAVTRGAPVPRGGGEDTVTTVPGWHQEAPSSERQEESDAPQPQERRSGTALTAEKTVPGGRQHLRNSSNNENDDTRRREESCWQRRPASSVNMEAAAAALNGRGRVPPGPPSSRRTQSRWLTWPEAG